MDTYEHNYLINQIDTMKKLLHIIAVIAVLCCACGKEYDDSELRNAVSSLEQRISAMETVMSAYKNKLLISSVSKTEDGYVIVFSDGSKAVVTNGRDGADGKPGKDGTDGNNGADGKPGKDGTNGKDGVDGETLIESIVVGEDDVSFILTDGRKFSIPLLSSISISFNDSDLVVMDVNSTRMLRYEIKSNISDVNIDVVSSPDIKAKVVRDKDFQLSGYIEVKTGDIIDEYSKVIVFVSNGEKLIMRSITFEKAGLVIDDNAEKNISAKGGEVTLEFLSNVKCEVVITDDAKSWISVAPDTKSLTKRTITLIVKPNTGVSRSATVNVSGIDDASKSILSYVVSQEAGEAWKDGTLPPDNEIWYTTKDNSLIQLDPGHYNKQPFNSNIISHTYEKGKGVIVCDAPIRVIHKSVFSNLGNRLGHITGLFLPNSITDLESQSLRKLKIRELRIPSELQYVGEGAFMDSSFELFTGEHTSEDGRLVYLENGYTDNYGNTRKAVQGYVAAFASVGLKSYSLPSYVKELGPYAFSNIQLEEIVFNEGLEVIDGCCFEHSVLDCEIRLPLSLKMLDSYVFKDCSGIRGFYGNSRFHTEDHHCLIFYSGNEKWINKFVGEDVVDYTIPNGIAGLDHYVFHNMPNLKTITFPSSISFVASSAIHNCPKLEAIYGECTSEDHRAIVFGTKFSRLFVAKGLKKYIVPDGFTSLGYNSFSDLFESEIEEIILPDSIVELGGYDFSGTYKLKKVVLSKNLKSVATYNPFLGSNNLEEIYFRSFIPPVYTDTQFRESDCAHLTVYVPEETLELYKHSGWSQYAPYMVGYKYDDIGEWNQDDYISSDYSQDGKVITLQSATKGKGINVVLMGDAYSDRQIADGTYGADMKYIYDNLFTEEPYKSFKEYFNVYSVNAVSATEGYDHGGAALGGYFGGGTLVGGNDKKCFEYAVKAVGEQNMDEALVVVAMNSDNYAGTCYMYYPSSTNGTYGSGTSVAYFPKGGDKETFARLLHHEACGHGFAKLADEYAYESMGTVPSDYVSQTQTQQNNWGWWKNVDFTNDLSAVRWSRFISDSRYADEGLGAFEGGLTYWSGVWRPTENSIMRHNTGGFNAPSREAIYYRIHKLAYGDSWEYDYENFVKYDEINRKASSSAHWNAFNPENYRPLHPPVVVGKSWKDVTRE